VLHIIGEAYWIFLAISVRTLSTTTAVLQVILVALRRKVACVRREGPSFQMMSLIRTFHSTSIKLVVTIHHMSVCQKPHYLGEDKLGFIIKKEVGLVTSQNLIASPYGKKNRKKENYKYYYEDL
tara:strand:- start:932 stop:1303 length:372 start_codon:yes stop_codon:yes gene_type:complete